jgi:FMN hydrolase / 5-amino-6-(5-phospho-D-ribitylamino)uracil phosphatase
VIVRAEQEMYDFICERYPRIAAKYSIEALRSERERIAKSEPHMHHDFTYLRKASLKHCALSVGHEAEIAEEVFEVFYRARNNVTLYHDAAQALPDLKKQYRLFSLTNGNADLKTIGLDAYFEHRFAARDVGALKPDPKAFKHVLDETRLDPQQVLFVGDDPVADIHGARAAGMHCVWMNRDAALWPSELGVPPKTIARLTELLPLLRAPI